MITTLNNKPRLANFIRQNMDEEEFRRLLDLFPVVRSRDYCAELNSSRQLTSPSASTKELIDWQDAWDDGEIKQVKDEGIDLHDKFWKNLKLAAEKKVGAVEADKFCKAFQHVHKKLVCEGLSSDAAMKLLNSPKH